MSTIAFTGDIAFSKYFSKSYEKPDLMDGEIVDFLRSADHVIANIEAPITAGDIQSTRSLNHVNSPEVVPVLLNLNARIWSLANNHVLDCKEQGLRDTLDIAAKNGVRTLGAGMNKEEAARIVEFPGGGGVGVFSVTYHRDFLKAGADKPGCVLDDDFDTIREKIAEIKKNNRWCVLISHGGEEFAEIPLPYVRRRYLKYLEMGVDIIVGHHPHVVQNYEQVGSKIIFYSLGNFVFDTDYQRQQRYSHFGVLLKLHFNENGFRWEHLGTRVDRENNRVTVSKAPANFTHIPPREYRRLWPLVAKNYFRADRRANVFTNPEKANFNEFRWLKHEIKYFGFWQTMELRWGRARAWMGTWKTVRKELLDYVLWP